MEDPRETLARNLELRSKFITKEDFSEYVNTVLKRGFKFHNDNWSCQAEELETKIKKNPRAFRALERSFGLFLTAFGPKRMELPEDSDDKPKMTADKLAELELSPDQIKKLGGIDEEK